MSNFEREAKNDPFGFDSKNEVYAKYFNKDSF